DSLKIWSTLQTFLQYRNPSRTQPSFHKIWTIIPYDQKGLESIWSGQEKYKPINGSEERNIYSPGQVAKSFFEKSFLLRVEVPLPNRTTWETFAKKQMAESFKNWNQKEIEEVYAVLRSGISKLDKNLTPREIKTFINQVGFVRTYADPSISLTAIAFYIAKRYLGCVSVQDITEGLLSTTLITASDRSYLPEDIENQLSGLV